MFLASQSSRCSRHMRTLGRYLIIQLQKNIEENGDRGTLQDP